MLLASLDQILDDPVRGLITLATFSLALVIGLTFHEFSHALSAFRLGDPTAKLQGRLTLHPRAHMDPLGSAMIFLAGFGWAKPTPVNLGYLRIGQRPGMAVVSLAGPVSNVVLAALFAVPFKAGVVTSAFLGFHAFHGQPGDIPAYVVGSLVFWNLLLASFNLVPVAPLDGFKVALGVLPRDMAASFARLERHGPTILLLLILSGLVLPGGGLLFRIVQPILNTLSFILLGRQLM